MKVFLGFIGLAFLTIISAGITILFYLHVDQALHGNIKHFDMEIIPFVIFLPCFIIFLFLTILSGAITWVYVNVCSL